MVICKATSDGLRQHRSFPVSNNNTVAVAELSFGQVEYVGNVDNDGSGGFFYSLYPMGICQGKTSGCRQINMQKHRNLMFSCIPPLFHEAIVIPMTTAKRAYTAISGMASNRFPSAMEPRR